MILKVSGFLECTGVFYIFYGIGCGTGQARDDDCATLIHWAVEQLARLFFAAFVFPLMPVMAQSVGNCTARVVVGSPTTDKGDGGPARQAQFFSPGGITRDQSGNLYVADKVRMVRTDGTVQTIAGTGIAGGLEDGGAATSAQLNNPAAVAIGPGGAVYIVENVGNRIRKISSDGELPNGDGDQCSG